MLELLLDPWFCCFIAFYPSHGVLCFSFDCILELLDVVMLISYFSFINVEMCFITCGPHPWYDFSCLVLSVDDVHFIWFILFTSLLTLFFFLICFFAGFSYSVAELFFFFFIWIAGFQILYAGFFFCVTLSSLGPGWIYLVVCILFNFWNPPHLAFLSVLMSLTSVVRESLSFRGVMLSYFFLFLALLHCMCLAHLLVLISLLNF